MSRSGCMRRRVATMSRLSAPDRSPPPCHPGGSSAARRGAPWPPVPRGRLAGRRCRRRERACPHGPGSPRSSHRPPSRSIQPTAGAERSAAVRVLAEMGVAGTAATAFGQTLWAQRRVGSTGRDLPRGPSVWRKRVPPRRTTSWPGMNVLGAPYAVSTLGTGSRCTRARSVLQMPASAGRMSTHPGPGWNRRPDVAYLDGKRRVRLRATTTTAARPPEPGSMRVGSTTSARIGRAKGWNRREPARQ